MSAPRPPTLVLGEASESDSEPELGGGGPNLGGGPTLWGGPPAGLKVPGEASESEDEAEPPPGPPPEPPRTPIPPPKCWGGVVGGGGGGPPSLLQQRLGAGEGRLRGGGGRRLGAQFRGGPRGCWGRWGGPWGGAQAGAAAAAHCLRLARRDLAAVAATLGTVTACRLLPPGGLGGAGGGGGGMS
ncbi:biogenesis of lysosome-related organelles complex 1 subunit 3 [Anas acuta]|uniref:biogenesis of lysosome-related organelles complex 1 subunit 3 n=1 Tax=Anas acuta TaxID=28680 RepID=UPI0035C93E38